MKTRTLSTLLLTVAVALVTFARPALAGECFGMINYEYSGGECVDKDGDSSKAMSGMWDDSYRQQQGMIDRSKAIFSGRAAGPTGTYQRRARVPTPAEQRALATTLLTHMMTPSDVVERIAAALPAKSVRDRRIAGKFLREAVTDFAIFGPRAGYGRFNVAGAREFFLTSAYFVFDGDHAADRLSLAVLNSVVTSSMIMAGRVPQMSDMDKRRLYDAYIIYGIGLLSEYHENLRKHDPRALASTRASARRLIAGDIGVDPAKVRIDKLPCVQMPIPVLSCDQIVQYYRSGGMKN